MAGPKEARSAADQNLRRHNGRKFWHECYEQRSRSASAMTPVAISARFDRRRSTSAPAGVWVRVPAIPPTVRASPMVCCSTYSRRDKRRGMDRPRFGRRRERNLTNPCRAEFAARGPIWGLREVPNADVLVIGLGDVFAACFLLVLWRSISMPFTIAASITEWPSTIGLVRPWPSTCMPSFSFKARAPSGFR